MVELFNSVILKGRKEEPWVNETEFYGQLTCYKKTFSHYIYVDWDFIVLPCTCCNSFK